MAIYNRPGRSEVSISDTTKNEIPQTAMFRLDFFIKKAIQTNVRYFLFAAGIFTFLFLVAQYSFLLFHTFAELLGIGVSLGIFFIAWNAQTNIDNQYFLFLGICHFFIALVSVLHTLAYRGMNIFQGYDANLPTQLWILGGFLQCAVFLAAPLFLKRKLNTPLLFYGGLALLAIILGLIFKGYFPDCYIEGKGLTFFKKNSELLICSGLLLAIIPIHRNFKAIDPLVKKDLTMALVLNSLTRVSFIFYVSVYGLSNLLGHALYLLYVYFIYRVIIQETLVRPQNILFAKLNRKTKALEAAGKKLRIKIAERTKELEQANANLIHINADLQDFVHIVSHDLREPLRGISNFATLLVDENADKLDHECNYMLDTMVRLARRQEEMINDILQYSRLGQRKPVSSNVDMNLLVSQIMDNLQALIAKSQAKIRIPAPLPTLNFDPVLLEHILSNLISNAIKFNDKPEKWVEVGSLSDHSPPVIYVRDNGIGIPERHIDKIFTLFKRFHKKEAYGGGTGAGLAIVKNIIDRNNCRIWFESLENKGSCFFFSLPETPDIRHGPSMVSGLAHKEF